MCVQQRQSQPAKAPEEPVVQSKFAMKMMKKMGWKEGIFRSLFSFIRRISCFYMPFDCCVNCATFTNLNFQIIYMESCISIFDIQSYTLSGFGLGKDQQGIAAPLIAQKTDANVARIVQSQVQPTARVDAVVPYVFDVEEYFSFVMCC